LRSVNVGRKREGVHFGLGTFETCPRVPTMSADRCAEVAVVRPK
jgi:hypothetical protein